jgi:ferredoxin
MRHDRRPVGYRLTAPTNVLECSPMANKADKWKENVSGRFYVDQQCIDCDLCRETAPGFFTRNDEGGYSYVHRQPTAEEEVQLCMEALEGCPVEAIGNDGDA